MTDWRKQLQDEIDGLVEPEDYASQLTTGLERDTVPPDYTVTVAAIEAVIAMVMSGDEPWAWRDAVVAELEKLKAQAPYSVKE